MQIVLTQSFRGPPLFTFPRNRSWDSCKTGRIFSSPSYSGSGMAPGSGSLDSTCRSILLLSFPGTTCRPGRFLLFSPVSHPGQAPVVIMTFPKSAPVGELNQQDICALDPQKWHFFFSFFTSTAALLSAASLRLASHPGAPARECGLHRTGFPRDPAFPWPCPGLPPRPPCRNHDTGPGRPP